MFSSKIKKNRYTPAYPSLAIYKWGSGGYTLHGYVFVMHGTDINPYLMSGFSLLYHLGESTFIFRGVRCDFKILFNFSMKIL